MDFKVIVENEEALGNSHIFLTGFHGLGECGFIVVRHIVEAMNLERVAVITSLDGSPPFVSVEGGKIRLPFEIYAKNEIAVFVPFIQPYRHLQVEFAEKLAEWVLSRKHFKECLLIGGVDERLKTDPDTSFAYIPSRQYKNERSQNEKHIEKIENMVLDTGLYVAGPLAIMLGYFDLRNFSSLALLSYAARDRPDPLAAARAIKHISEILTMQNISFEVDVRELEDNAQLIEAEIKRQLEFEQETIEKTKDDPSRLYT
ncbi:MAG: proteasome assembly chaperone family protein [Candidatus Hodarchaeota archaeon]